MSHRRCTALLTDVHVYRDAVACWLVVGGRRTVTRHRTQGDATRCAIRIAKRLRVDVVVHARSGRFRSKDSYGNESRVHDTEH